MKKKLLVLLSLLSMVTVGAMGAVACDKGNENNNSTSESQSSSESESESPSESESESDSSSGDVTPATYTVKFVDEDGTELSSATYEEGAPVSIPAAPVKEATAAYTYEFAGWDKEVTAATADVTYTATYTQTAVNYTITFMDGETVVGTATFNVETKEIEEPEVPTKAGYNSVWNDYDLTLLEDQTVTVFSMAIKYTITFVNGNDTVGSIIFSVEDNEKDAPAIAEKAGYTLNVGEYDLNKFENQTVEVTYTANTYAITYNANGGTVATETQYVTFDDNVTLAVPTPPAAHREFLGWVDGNGNIIKDGKWTIADNVTLTATYSNMINFESATEVPAYFKNADTTEKLEIVEVNGNKMLKMTNGATTSAPALIVTIDFLSGFFSDVTVDYVAFDAKSELGNYNNFRRVTLRSNGTFAADCYDADLVHNDVPTSGIRSDAFKTFYFSRADYEAWVAQGVTEERIIASGGIKGGDSFYVDNFRPVTASELKADSYDFENGGVRLNDGGRTLLFYTSNSKADWDFNFQVGSGNVFTNVGYTNETVSNGMRALTFTKEAGVLSFNLASAKLGYTNIAKATGFWAVDVYIPAEADTTFTAQYATWPAAPLKKGTWNTIYVADSHNQLTFNDTTGGTYYVDNMRSITADEYMLGGVNFQPNASGLRDNTGTGNVFYYYGGADHKVNRYTFAVSGGSGVELTNPNINTEMAHGNATHSLSFTKGAGATNIQMRADSNAYQFLKNGFTFWLYTTVAINGTTTGNFNNGNNEKFNGGAGVNIPANTWVQITVTAEDMPTPTAEESPIPFLKLAGSTAGTYYISDIQPLK